MMDYVAVTFNSKNQDFNCEVLMAYLAELEYETFEELETGGLLAYVPKQVFNIERIDALLLEKFESMDIGYNYETIEDRNWNAVWESNYDSVIIADRCLIRAPFHDEDDSMEFQILIEPQMSFGTAHHETTAMMIEYALDAELSNKQILDMGSGTGVLAILASMRGAKEIDAIDNDEWAYKNCVDNVAKNKISNIQVIQGDASVVVKKYDVIFANINLNILVRDMGVYVKALDSGGFIYFSGFYNSDLKKLQETANQLHLSLVDTNEKNKWMAACFMKK
jgi:ribosomal protein L11 methyltransferase